MALDVAQPAAGESIGWGCGITIHTNGGATTGDIGVCELFYLDSLTQHRQLCLGRGVFSAASDNAPIMLGLDELGGPLLIGYGASGLLLGGLVSVKMTRLTAGFVLIETTTLADYFIHDPVSQIGLQLSGLVGHDPMLDDILAAVRRTFPVP